MTYIVNLPLAFKKAHKLINADTRISSRHKVHHHRPSSWNEQPNNLHMNDKKNNKLRLIICSKNIRESSSQQSRFDTPTSLLLS